MLDSAHPPPARARPICMMHARGREALSVRVRRKPWDKGNVAMAACEEVPPRLGGLGSAGRAFLLPLSRSATTIKAVSGQRVHRTLQPPVQGLQPRSCRLGFTINACKRDDVGTLAGCERGRRARTMKGLLDQLASLLSPNGKKKRPQQAQSPDVVPARVDQGCQSPSPLEAGALRRNSTASQRQHRFSAFLAEQCTHLRQAEEQLSVLASRRPDLNLCDDDLAADGLIPIGKGSFACVWAAPSGGGGRSDGGGSSGSGGSSDDTGIGQRADQTQGQRRASSNQSGQGAFAVKVLQLPVRNASWQRCWPQGYHSSHNIDEPEENLCDGAMLRNGQIVDLASGILSVYNWVNTCLSAQIL